MPESVYQEIGRRDKDTAWMTVEGQEALAAKCVVCHAPPQHKCCNPISGHPRKIWCIGRTDKGLPAAVEE